MARRIIVYRDTQHEDLKYEASCKDTWLSFGVENGSLMIWEEFDMGRNSLAAFSPGSWITCVDLDA